MRQQIKTNPQARNSQMSDAPDPGQHHAYITGVADGKKASAEELERLTAHGAKNRWTDDEIMAWQRQEIVRLKAENERLVSKQTTDSQSVTKAKT